MSIRADNMAHRRAVTDLPDWKVEWDALPCPFCGWVPNITPWHGGGPRKRRIACCAEQCDVQPSVTGSTRLVALRRWNTRDGAATRG